MKKNKWHLDGKRALITGGTKGIGLAVAQEILKLGGEVYIVARNADLVEGCLTSWRKQGFSALGSAVDISNADGRENLLEDIVRHWDRLDILINNVGTNIRKLLNIRKSNTKQ